MARAGLSPTLAAFLGWLPLALVEVIVIHERVAAAHGLRLATVYGHELGNAVAAGAISALVVAGFTWARGRLLPRFGRGGALAIDLFALLIVGLSIALYARTDMDNFAARHADDLHVSPAFAKRLAVMAMTAGIATALPIGRLFARPWIRWIAVAISAGLVAVNFRILENDYFSAHFALAMAAAILAGSALVGAEVPAFVRPPAALAKVGQVLLGMLAAWSIAVPPPPGLVAQILWTRATPFTPLLRLWGYHGPRGTPVVPPEQAAWFASRDDLPPKPSNVPADVAKRTIFLMLTIDCFRSDVFEDPDNDGDLPEISQLREGGVHFTHAYSPGAQTVYTMTSWFTGKYYSEIFWKLGGGGQYWPSADKTQRFPAYLQEKDVPSFYVMAGNWLTDKQGLVGGFTDYADLQKGLKYNKYAPARRVADRVIRKLEAQGSGPLYIFAHFMDAHQPHRGIPAGLDEHEQYLAELNKVDGEIGRIRNKVGELGLEDRTTIVVSADHGEAFGDHGTHSHGVSLYDELIHVPLVITGPGIAARTVDALVSTIDLGPTILDSFGLATPSSMMGESLVPVLHGGEPQFTRPIVAENRLSQTMIFPSGKKVVRDLWFGGGAAFDLHSDPRENDNRIDDASFDTKNEFAMLDAFFRVHTYARKGYKTPWRR